MPQKNFTNTLTHSCSHLLVFSCNQEQYKTNIPSTTNHQINISINANTITNSHHNIYTNSNICISIDAATNTNTYTLMMLTVMLSPRLILTLIIC